MKVQIFLLNGGGGDYSRINRVSGYFRGVGY